MTMNPIDRLRLAVNEREPMTTDQLRTTWSQLFNEIVMPEVLQARDGGDAKPAFAILAAAWEHAFAVGVMDNPPPAADHPLDEQ